MWTIKMEGKTSWEILLPSRYLLCKYKYYVWRDKKALCKLNKNKEENNRKQKSTVATIGI